MYLTFKCTPLSVNKAWKHRTHKSKEYLRYDKTIGNMLLLQKSKEWPLKGALEIECVWYLKQYKRTDWDNPIKPFIDLLVKYGVIEDDKFIIKGTVTKKKSDHDWFTTEIKPFKEG